jgi:lipoyl(octanoyl) transferase
MLHMRRWHTSLSPFNDIWRRMQTFTDQRSRNSEDEIWFVQHPSVFTLGMNADPGHLIDPGNIPVIQIDRGGQVTYHGPGQLVVYPLLDLRRLRMGVRELVMALETAVVETVASYGITAAGRRDAPGVYVNKYKLASIGLRIRRGCCYHGMALNVSMDLTPFARINPCGFSDMRVTQMSELTQVSDLNTVQQALEARLLAAFAGDG